MTESTQPAETSTATSTSSCITTIEQPWNGIDEETVCNIQSYINTVASEREDIHLREIQQYREQNRILTAKLAENQKDALQMEAVVTCLRDKLDIKKQLVARERAASNQLRVCLQDILRSLPTQTMMFESGRTHLHTTGGAKALPLIFAKSFVDIPRITAWVTNMGTSTIHKIPQSSITNITRTGFQVTPGSDWESEFHVDWLAFAPPVVDSKVAGLIQLVEASPPSLTPELERNTSHCIAHGGVNQADITGTTLLHAACHSGNMPLVKWLLGKGANLESPDKHGWTPLLSALSNGHTDIALLLLQKGADPSVTSDEGTHSLHYMCKLKSISGSPSTPNESYRTVFKMLYKSGVDPKAASSSGDHCLLLAAKTGNLVALGELLEICQMNPNTFDSRGLSPLHIAVCTHNFDMAKILLANGANPTIQSSVGIPLDMVMQTGLPEWIDAFQKATQTLLIPAYTVTEILSLLPPRDLYRCRRVCKDFRAIVDEIVARPSYWTALHLSKECFVNSAVVYHQFSSGLEDFIIPKSTAPTTPAMRADGTYIPDYDYFIKIVILGDRNVGKKGLIEGFCQSPISEGSENAITTVRCNGKVVKLQVWKYFAYDSFRTRNMSYIYRGLTVAMLCFDLTDRVSFRNLKQWHMEVRRYAPVTVMELLVGMKSDLPGRVISAEEIEELCAAIKRDKEEDLDGKPVPEVYYVETSSKMSFNVNLAFKVATHLGVQTKDIAAKPLTTINTTTKKDCLIC
ncbi:GTP-binding protein yptV1 [Pelomyxa schiedti]|nr:GTP-binding protein yptV1 [Pelomyxa schiedti]